MPDPPDCLSHCDLATGLKEHNVWLWMLVGYLPVSVQPGFDSKIVVSFVYSINIAELTQRKALLNQIEIGWVWRKEQHKTACTKL